jgi:hypothetical protein
MESREISLKKPVYCGKQLHAIRTTATASSTVRMGVIAAGTVADDPSSKAPGIPPRSAFDRVSGR